MKLLKAIIVLYGGIGEEREVSIQSGEQIIDSLNLSHKVEAICLDEPSLPGFIDPDSHIVFPMIHGAFGENGELQKILAEKGIEFLGCDAVSSALCMDKAIAKERVKSIGIKTSESFSFDYNSIPLADDIINSLGGSLVLKPRDSGSSYGVKINENRSSLGAALSSINSGNWLVERRLRGKELTIGILGGKALEVVEIKYSKDCYDYDSKYFSNSTKYQCPAELPDEIMKRIKCEAEAIFNCLGCRDFARIDFILEGDIPYFLEVNTIPGMTPKSLFPKSAAATGIDFNSLILIMLSYGLDRFNKV